MPEEPRVLQLEVLAYEIETGLGSELEVPHERLVVRRRDAGIGPVALVEDSSYVEAFAVQDDVAALGVHLAQATLDGHPVRPVRRHEGGGHVVQVGVGGLPEPGMIDRQLDGRLALDEARRDRGPSGKVESDRESLNCSVFYLNRGVECIE